MPDLDSMLAEINPAEVRPRSIAMEDLATRAQESARPRRLVRPVRRLAIGLLGAATAVALAAAITPESFLLSISPFVGLEDGTQRSSVSLPFTPSIGSDAGEACQLFPEFRGLSNEQLSNVDDHIESADWSTLPARVDAALPSTGNVDEASYGEAEVSTVYGEFATVVPGLSMRGASPSFEGFTLSCRPDAG